jgi:hypothetical protein
MGLLLCGIAFLFLCMICWVKQACERITCPPKLFGSFKYICIVEGMLQRDHRKVELVPKSSDEEGVELL